MQALIDVSSDDQSCQSRKQPEHATVIKSAESDFASECRFLKKQISNQKAAESEKNIDSDVTARKPKGMMRYDSEDRDAAKSVERWVMAKSEVQRGLGYFTRSARATSSPYHIKRQADPLPLPSILLDPMIHLGRENNQHSAFRHVTANLAFVEKDDSSAILRLS
jgi:hypothetical protein